MFSSKGFIDDVNDIPATWIFENYLGLEPLTGQSVRIKSLFNDEDKDPSMFIYFDKKAKEYKFKCFSTNISGNAINLMMLLWKTSFSETAIKIKKDYKDFIISGKTVTTLFQEQSFWKLTSYTVRQWNTLDAKYWLEFNINSNILKRYNVKPIETYTMSKINDENIVENSFNVTKNYVYGFFKNDGTLYKIYQPYNKERKFIIVNNYLQGYEQLTGKHNRLIIASSLKDCMSIAGLNIQADLIAPQSENSYLKNDVIEKLKSKYNVLCTLFDSDKSGIKAMEYYKETYNIPFIYLNREKDISDIIKYHGKEQATYDLVSGFNRLLYQIEFID